MAQGRYQRTLRTINRRTGGLTRHRGARLAAAASALTVLGLLTPGVAQASQPLGRATQIKPPSNVMPGSGTALFSVSCAGSQTCGAGGTYTDNADHDRAMVVSESGAHWARARELRMPGNAAANPAAQVASVACTGAGACVAAGFYSAGSRSQGFAATESHGSWARATRLQPPANAMQPSRFQITGVACTAPGSCVAVGNYEDAGGLLRAMAVTESGGRWHRGFTLHMPANAAANPDAFLVAVSCGRPGSCAAGGSYSDQMGHVQPVALVESGGKWHRGTEIKLPNGANANPSGDVAGITCPVAGTCLAVGHYIDTMSQPQAFTVTYSAGTWRRAARFTHVPSNAAPHPAALLDSVTCVRAGTCVAVGQYTDTAGGRASLAAFRHGGHWLLGIQIGAPSNAQGGGTMLAEAESVSCTARAFCAMVGFYQTKAARNASMGATTP